MHDVAYIVAKSQDLLTTFARSLALSNLFRLPTTRTMFNKLSVNSTTERDIVFGIIQLYHLIGRPTATIATEDAVVFR